MPVNREAEDYELDDEWWNVDDEDDDTDYDEDEDDEDYGDEDTEDEDDGDDDEADEANDPVTKALAEYDRRLVEAIENGDTGNGVYKGLQRVISRKDAELAERDEYIAQLSQFVMGLAETVEELKDGTEWSAETLLGALEEGAAAAARTKLAERKSSRKQTTLERQVEALSRGGGGARQSQTASGNLSPEVQQRIATFVNGRRDAAKRAGIDPNNPLLDYGTDDEGLIERLDKFEKSLEKAVKAKRSEEKNKRVDSVRSKGTQPRTRGASGGDGGADDMSGPDLLSRVSNSIFKDIQREISGSSGRRRKR